MADLVDVVEAAYSPSIDEAAWLSGVAAAASTNLDAGRVVAFTYDASEAEWVHVGQLAAVGVEQSVLQGLFHVPTVRGQESHSFAQLFRTATFASVRDPRVAVHPMVRQYFCSILDQNGLPDLCFFNATNPSHLGCMLVVLPPAPHRWTPRETHRWKLVAAHLAAGLRVRRSLKVDPPAGAATTLGAEAVLRPDGHLEHAEQPAQGSLARAALRRSAAARDHAKGPLRRKDPDAALAVWEGLVAGRWSLIDHVDSDGRRYVLARRNQPGTPDIRGLTLRERQVLAYVAMGHSNKLVGYHLGLTASSVAGHLARARQKLHLRSASAIRDVLATGGPATNAD
jgi:DNA-binding CsgD family transcriptional regulator